jgi:hypothetical protein
VSAALLPGGQILAADPPQVLPRQCVSAPQEAAGVAFASSARPGSVLPNHDQPRDQLPVLLMGRTPSPPRARGRADGVCQGDRYHQSPTPTTPQPPDLVVLVAERTPPRGNITHQRLAMAIVSDTARSPTTQTGRQAAGTAPTHPCPVPRCRL